MKNTVKIKGLSLVVLLLFTTILGVAPAEASLASPSSMQVTLAAVDLNEVDASILDESEAMALITSLKNSQDPVALMSSFDYAQLANVKAYLAPSLESSLAVAPTPKMLSAFQNGCWNAAVAYVARNFFSIELYRVTLKGTWCTSAGQITSATNQGLYPSISAMGWQPVAVLSKGVYKLKTSATIYGQYRFDYYVAGVFLQSDTPCLRILASGDSSYSLDGLCGP